MTKTIKTFFRHVVSMLCLGGLLLTSMSIVSCSEDKDDVEEFANWKATNENYWNKLYTTTEQKIKGGDTSWKIIKNYTLDGQHAVGNAQLSYKPENHIIVHVLESGSETKSPLLTDFASVHYMGRLIPSTTYTAGLIFDKSWSSNTFNATTSRPTHFEVRGVVDGFATALQQMHRGDHWVMVP